MSVVIEVAVLICGIGNKGNYLKQKYIYHLKKMNVNLRFRRDREMKIFSYFSKT